MSLSYTVVKLYFITTNLDVIKNAYLKNPFCRQYLLTNIYETLITVKVCITWPFLSTSIYDRLI